MVRAAALTLAILAMTSCAEKHIKPDGPGMYRKGHHKLALAQGVHIEFRGIKDGACVIGDVLVNAKGGYVVICK
jgi:hypothetical protein